jgi:hypothetical protein
MYFELDPFEYLGARKVNTPKAMYTDKSLIYLKDIEDLKTLGAACSQMEAALAGFIAVLSGEQKKMAMLYMFVWMTAYKELKGPITQDKQFPHPPWFKAKQKDMPVSVDEDFFKMLTDSAAFVDSHLQKLSGAKEKTFMRVFGDFEGTLDHLADYVESLLEMQSLKPGKGL